MRVHGICERADSPGPIGPDALVPDSVPLTLNFDLSKTMGRATLSVAPNGDILASADIRPGSHEEMLVRRRIVPYFAVSAIAKPGEPAFVNWLSVCESNIDPDLPPYEITE
jgi:hypothetical protein